MPTDFYEDDEPVEKIKAVWASGDKGLTGPPADDDDTSDLDMTEAEWDEAFKRATPCRIVVPVAFRCEHMTWSVHPSSAAAGVPTFGCGCKPKPVFAPGDEPSAV